MLQIIEHPVFGRLQLLRSDKLMVWEPRWFVYGNDDYDYRRISGHDPSVRLHTYDSPATRQRFAYVRERLGTVAQPQHDISKEPVW